MRHLNTGETKLFNVAKDMGETKDLSKSLPEKKEAMVRKIGCLFEEGGSVDHGGSVRDSLGRTGQMDCGEERAGCRLQGRAYKKPKGQVASGSTEKGKGINCQASQDPIRSSGQPDFHQLAVEARGKTFALSRK